MSTKDFELQKEDIPAADEAVVAIVAAEWNAEITDALLEGAESTLREYGVPEENILTYRVPGTFELVYAAKRIIDEFVEVEAVIVLGAVIQGETRHFDFICQGVTQGITQINAEGETPVIFGVLTTDNFQQARDRAGGKLGNKGAEAAVAALKMIAFDLEIDYGLD